MKGVSWSALNFLFRIPYLKSNEQPVAFRSWAFKHVWQFTTQEEVPRYLIDVRFWSLKKVDNTWSTKIRFYQMVWIMSVLIRNQSLPNFYLCVSSGYPYSSCSNIKLNFGHGVFKWCPVWVLKMTLARFSLLCMLLSNQFHNWRQGNGKRLNTYYKVRQR